MPQIKIAELPQKGHADGIKDTDLMILEDTIDTYKVLVKDLKIVFSADEKITAMRTNLENQINNVQKQVDNLTTKYDNSISNLEGQYATVNQDITDAKKKMQALQQSQLQLETSVSNLDQKTTQNANNITDLFSKYATQDRDISNLKSTVKNHGDQIAIMGQTLTTNSDNISALQTRCADIENSITVVNGTLQKNIDNLRSDLTTYADTLYDRCIKYIDYYHHIHENPPNFDEPYNERSNTTVAYIMPVGAIYETMDKDYDPNDHLPGSWYFCGLGTATETSNMKQVQYYTWTRVK